LDAVAGQLQQSPPDAAKVGAGWTPTFEFTIPHEWPNGLYAAKLSSATRKFNVGFVVREADPGTQGRLAVVLSNFTWEVYNKWGGASFYHYELDDGDGVVINATGFQVSPFVSQDRPNPIEGDPIAGARARAERRILQWLESRGYSHAVLCDDDLHRDPSILSAYDAVILNAHPEYYSDNMYDALDDFLDQGGSLAYFGGNGVYWRVTVEGRQIECRKEQDYSERLHTHAAYAGQLGGRWRDIGRPESALLGVEFNEDWYNATHGSSYTPYAVLQPEHWAFAGLDLQTGDTVGSRGRNLWNGSTGGASGFEIDRVTDHSPANIELLAEATGDPAGAHMTYYTHPGGGGVFSGGSIAFGLGLDLDENLATVVENVLDSFLEE
jgi:hypothetical protein